MSCYLADRLGQPSIRAFRALSEFESYKDISLEAYRLRSSREYLDLKEYIARHPSDSISSRVRHYIGRLASWAKCVTFIVQAATSHDTLQFPIRIRHLPSQQMVISEGLTREQALDAMVDSLGRAGVEEPLRSCESKWSPVLNIYKDRWQSLKLRTTVHAEMTILDHFYRHDLSFAHDKRYIGCSKPSCYCCGVYMAGHALKLEERPCHNNVWVKLSLPHQPSFAGIKGSKYSSSSLTNLHNIIKQKIKEELSCGTDIGRQRLFDSTTDLSASLPTIFNSMLLRSAESNLGEI